MSTQDDGRYIRFEPKYDNANEVISADHINRLQDTSERTQKDIFIASDRDFLDKALFVLEHHRYINGMWLDTFDDTSRIDIARSSHVVFSEAERAIVFPESSTSLEGWIYSQPYINPHRSNMKQVMVIANLFMPEGTNIYIEVTNNGADWYHIPYSDSELFEIPSDGGRLQLRARLSRSEEHLSPRLDAWAILYHDPANNIITLRDGREVTIGPKDPEDGGGGSINLFHHQLMGIGPNDHHDQEHKHDGKDGSGIISHSVLTDVGEDDHHPKDHRHGQDGVDFVNLETDVVGSLGYENLSYQIWTGKPGTTGLYFDPSIDDKLVYVKSPDDETYLFYDLKQDQLSHTITIVQGVAVWEELIFGDYINSNGETTIVLKGTEKTHYDARDNVIQQEIQKIAAPTRPTGLRATDLGTGDQVRLEWNPNTEFDLIGYNVYRSSDEGVTWILCNTTGMLTSTNFTISGLTREAEYHFSVTALDTQGYESDKSVSAKGRATIFDTVAPEVITGINATRAEAGDIIIEWNAGVDSDIANYLIYSSPTGFDGSFSIVQAVPVGALSFLHAGLTVGTTHYYYVTAQDTSGNESIPSIIVSAIA